MHELVKCSAKREFLVGLAFFSTLLTIPAAALDSRYGPDTDGNLVADVPTATVNPSELKFAYTPGQDPATYGSTWAGFLHHLEVSTGKHVKLVPIQSNTAQIEAMRAGKLHIAGFGTGTVPLAVNCAGFVPFAVMGGERGRLTYEMEIITFRGSGITKPEDLRVRKVAFTSETSNSGFKLPSLLLRRDFKLEAGRDYIARFAGKHENSIIGVANKDYDAAAIANDVLRRMIADGVVNKDQLVTIYKSESFPTAAFGLAHNLSPALAKKLRDAFFSFPWPGSELQKEFGILGASKFLPIIYKDDWARVRKVDAEVGDTYDCK